MQRVIGLVIVAGGLYLALQPQVIADLIHAPVTKPTQWINLRASYGGTIMGLGAFVAWVKTLKPWSFSVLGLLGWAMAGIGLARLIGFAIDGHPDGRQAIWITAEVLLAAGCWFWIRRLRARARP